MFMILIFGLIWVVVYLIFRRTVLRLPRCKSDTLLHGKTAIVTGANTGIGKETAMGLARRGARVILACRDQQRTEAAVQEIVQETGNQQVIFMQMDLANLQSVHSFAENFLKTESRLDLLINNAGICKDGQTDDGFGMIFAVNHLGHFLLTALLLDRLQASGPSRVVTVADICLRWGNVDFDCLTNQKDFSLGSSQFQLYKKYCSSKLCNVLFTYELAKRLQGTSVTCYSLHPGFIKTEIGRYFSLWLKLLMLPIFMLFFMDAESGAQTTLHCALEKGIEGLSGHHFSRCALRLDTQAKTRDDVVARKLWELSERICNLS